MLGKKIALGAIIIMAGSILSRMLGLGRVATIAGLFGAGGSVSAFQIASNVSTIIYDLLVSGMVSAALVPVLSEYTAPEKREELGRILGIVLTGAIIVVAVGVGLLEIFPGPLVNFMSSGLNAADQQSAINMTRIALPGVIFMGMSAIFTAALYALQRFAYPSFAMASQNIAIIVAAFVVGEFLGVGVSSLAIGLLIGAIAMVALQWPGLRDVPIRLSLNFRHPAVQRILILYGPIAVSLIVSTAGLVLDRHFATEVSPESVAAMTNATTLIQFGLGIVGAAISVAALPSLSQHFANGDETSFKRTLGMGLRTVTVLSVPTAAALFFLSAPVVSVLLQRGHFGEEDKWRAVLALLLYLPALPAAALDQVLIFGFYSRKNTVTPVIVGVCAVMVYVVVALLLRGPLGMAGLVLAWSAQWIFHPIVTGILLYRRLNGLPGERIFATGVKAILGGVMLGLVSFLTWGLLGGSTVPRGIVHDTLLLIISGGVGLLAFLGVMAFLRVPEVFLLVNMVRNRLPGGRKLAATERASDAARASDLAADYNAETLNSNAWSINTAEQAPAQPAEETEPAARR